MEGIDLLRAMDGSVFAYFWNGSNSAKEMAKDFGVGSQFVRNLAAMWMARGVKLRADIRRGPRKRWTDEEFSKLWNSCDSIDEVVEKAGMIKGHCQVYAHRIRRNGRQLKKFNPGPQRNNWMTPEFLDKIVKEVVGNRFD